MNTYERGKALIVDWFDQEESFDLSISVGVLKDNTPAIRVDIGEKPHFLTAEEARSLAKVCEAALNRDPRVGIAQSMPDLIMGLRAGADKAELMALEAKGTA